MRNLLLAVGAILALNLVFGLGIAISELRSRLRARREIGALETLWVPPGSGRRRQGLRFAFARRTTAVAAAVVLLSGVALAMPDTRSVVVDTVSDVVGRITGDPTLGAQEGSPSDDPSGAAPAASPSPSARAGDDRGAGGERAGSGRPERNGPDPSSEDEPIAEPDPEPGPDPSDPTEPPPVEAFDVEAVPTSSTTVQISWEVLPAATLYTIERSVGGEWIVVSQESPGVGATIAGDLAPETAYEFRVTAMLENGETVAASAWATTPAPPAE